MQRRGINKRLSFAEAENGQKDRNKEEEVEEEREPATEKGINKSGEGERAERKKRERESEREETRQHHRQWVQLSSPLSLCSTNVYRSTTFAIRPSSCIESFYFHCTYKNRTTSLAGVSAHLVIRRIFFRIIGRI